MLGINYCTFKDRSYKVAVKLTGNEIKDKIAENVPFFQHPPSPPPMHDYISIEDFLPHYEVRVVNNTFQQSDLSFFIIQARVLPTYFV